MAGDTMYRSSGSASAQMAAEVGPGSAEKAFRGLKGIGIGDPKRGWCVFSGRKWKAGSWVRITWN